LTIVQYLTLHEGTDTISCRQFLLKEDI